MLFFSKDSLVMVWLWVIRINNFQGLFHYKFNSSIKFKIEPDVAKWKKRRVIFNHGFHRE